MNATVLKTFDLTRTKRILARTVLHNGTIFHLALIDASDQSQITIRPFDTETSNTIFIDGVVALLIDSPTHKYPDSFSTPRFKNAQSVESINKALQEMHLYPQKEQPAVHGTIAIQLL